jgi:hypothetical protein
MHCNAQDTINRLPFYNSNNNCYGDYEAQILKVQYDSVFCMEFNGDVSINELLKYKKLKRLEIIKGNIPEKVNLLSDLVVLQCFSKSKLSKNIYLLKNLQVLYLYDVNCPVFPKEILELKQLNSILIYSIQNGGFPKDINKLKLLEYLEINFRNNDVYIPVELCLLSNLGTLSIGSEGFVKIPEDFTKLKKIINLAMEVNLNDSTTLNIISKMTWIKKLFITSNCLPTQLNKLSNLSFLTYISIQDIGKTPLDGNRIKSLLPNTKVDIFKFEK